MSLTEPPNLWQNGSMQGPDFSAQTPTNPPAPEAQVMDMNGGIANPSPIPTIESFKTAPQTDPAAGIQMNSEHEQYDEERAEDPAVKEAVKFMIDLSKEVPPDKLEKVSSIALAFASKYAEAKNKH